MASGDPADNLPAGYVPAAVWTWDQPSGGAFANINRPVSGATHDKVLPVGKHPLQLYSLGTPNGVKVTIMLEELLAAGHCARAPRPGREYSKISFSRIPKLMAELMAQAARAACSTSRSSRP